MRFNFVCVFAFILFLPFVQSVVVDVQVNVSGVDDLAGVQFSIVHDSSFLYQGVIAGSFFGDPDSYVLIEPNHTVGLVSDFMIFRLNGSGVDGAGEIATFVFNSTANATASDFNLSGILLANSSAAPISNNSISFSIYNDGILFQNVSGEDEDLPEEDPPQEPPPALEEPEFDFEPFSYSGNYLKSDLAPIVWDGLGTAFSSITSNVPLIIMSLAILFGGYVLSRIISFGKGPL